MIVAIASGKGGTGKTTVAVNLARCAEGSVSLLDCDVEEPNCHIFVKPEIHRREPVTVPVPVVDESKCTACGECGRICQYHAIVSLKPEPLVFPEMCHGCGGCMRVCPTKAITEVPREVGVVEIGRSGGVTFVRGVLHVGEAMAPPVIRAVKRHIAREGLTIIDAPPGTSCPVITSVRGSDFVVLVTEPTPFGLHDLQLAVETVRQLDLPFGVVINRSDAGDERVALYCKEEGIPVLAEIPDDRRIAEAYSRGQIAVDVLPEVRPWFLRLYEEVSTASRRAGRERLQRRAYTHADA